MEEVKPVTLDDVRGGLEGTKGACCGINFRCNCDTDCADNYVVPCRPQTKPD